MAPNDLKARHANFKVFAGARPILPRMSDVKGQFLYGATPAIADAMYAPVATRFVTYSVPLNRNAKAYCATIIDREPMQR